MSNTQTESKQLVPFGKQGVLLSSLEDAFRFAKAVSVSGFAPKGIDTPESILIAVQFGAELGLTPMSALQSLAIINGRPSLYGDAALALVRASGELESYTQSTSGEGESLKATVRIKRKGESEIVSEFSVADAKKAQLWGKAGPWTQYPARMLMFRARGFALRDAFGDVLRGLATVEENQDLDIEPKLKAAKPVLPKRESAPATLPEPLAIGGPETSPKAATAESAKPEEKTALAPSQALDILITESGLTFADFVPTLHRSRLCARNAASVDDMTDANAASAVKDFAEILAVVKSEKAP